MEFNIGWPDWQGLLQLNPQSYVCGFCGDKVGSDKGYFHKNFSARIYICTNCGRPTFFYSQMQYPGPMLGKTILNLPIGIERIYYEIRESMKNDCYTAAILLGRKLIMHIAVDVAQAKEGESFKDYIKHLASSNYIPPNAGRLLEYLKNIGNEKNHEIKIGEQEEATGILKFIEALLYFIYEIGEKLDEIKEE
ncbi:DUF4145 domain-containing protein [Candidatus Collierbacteria bacterium]|nr:DUF4145 domain-containing protein [Candidatus Collierbacteria bacterium]